ncbi:hypothetical protein M8C21_018923 [Ambrosia artemisiifolia]|uniref:Uncharacterized protein n=1 Tax=Ambrosia artemisiifolia TaxID=4212 RepID=A0AAD5D7Z9_AMBAR|nr:hypothetical protein M8C21_018923 [Ambrosia artemisiifolia]
MMNFRYATYAIQKRKEKNCSSVHVVVNFYIQRVWFHQKQRQYLLIGLVIHARKKQRSTSKQGIYI